MQNNIEEVSQTGQVNSVPSASMPESNFGAPAFGSGTSKKSLAIILISAFVLAGAAYAGIWYWQKQSSSVPVSTFTPRPTPVDPTADWKTYTNTEWGFSFMYPGKLSLSTKDEAVRLSHSIPFENYDGGCDLKGGSALSKTLGDFNLSINIVSGEVKPPYVDGSYSAGILNGEWSYMGAEGCGQTNYYFPISGNRTLIVTRNETQILSDVVAPDVKARVLAVPGVISYEESKIILNQILSTFKFTDSTAGWRTYTNTEYGFEFKYPGTWPELAVISKPPFPGSVAQIWFEDAGQGVFGLNISSKENFVSSGESKIVGQNSMYVVVFAHSQAGGSAEFNRMAGEAYEKVKSTFKFTK